ncbi:hypothetical protein [Lelliottia sp. CFBP8978]|uniref:hypothetical protein n=1 Tax=Lelliottia sp. CFBP8978 TaxID=3096522 RepID=UPI002A6A3F9D|nr:hypothetical protein [Lelliottia sp. CFBP8978]MDY1035380.1 hypothetical protein [Lelliottia sp. CFBP8978]
MNSLNKAKLIVTLPVLALLYGCGDTTDRTLSPPPDAKWVDVSFRVPDGVTLLPLGVLYRSEKCKAVRYNSSNESHEIPGYNDFEQKYQQQRGSDIWQSRVAIEGGGACQWSLRSLRVSFRLSADNPLAKGKKIIDTSYIFDFGSYGLSDGYGTGRAKEGSGDLDLKVDFFPMVSNHIDKTASIKLFGGDSSYEKWSRRYRLQGTQNIAIQPIIHFDKVVTITPPATKPGSLIVTYPDGSSGKALHISPDYEKLLSMK